MTRLPITAVILARNEARNIEACLESLQWASEIVVVDDGSTDGTTELAELVGARVIQHRFESFARQRNWAMEHGNLQNEWTIHLDADEQATPDFAAALAGQLAAADECVAAFRVCRKTMFLNRWLRRSDGFPVWIMRIVKRGRAHFVDAGHGETPVPPVNGKVDTIRQPLVHHPFSKGLEDWFERHNRYSSREADCEYYDSPRLQLRELFAFDAATRRRALRTLGRYLPFRPLARFLYQYVLCRGFLDGSAGLTYCTLLAFYEAMIVAKVRERRSRRSASALSTTMALPKISTPARNVTDRALPEV